MEQFLLAYCQLGLCCVLTLLTSDLPLQLQSLKHGANQAFSNAGSCKSMDIQSQTFEPAPI